LEERQNLKAVLNQLVRLIDRLRQSNPLSRQRLRGIGLTIQGTLNLDGVIICAPFLGWQGVDLRRYLQPHLDLPLFVDNDANAAALAQVYLGNAMPTHSLLYLLINKGMGAGIVINNRVFRGAYGTAGEVGAWLTEPICNAVDGMSNQPRDLGLSVGREALMRHYRERGGTASDIGELVEHLAQAEPLARMLIGEWAQVLGWGIINLVNAFNPERIVIGGSLTALIPYVKDQLDAMLRHYVPGDGADGFFSNPNARFEVSAFGEDAAAIGGAVLAYQSLFQVPDLVLLKG
ncbi:MAG: ROK family protein, partial [Cyanobacteriota bacterium]